MQSAYPHQKITTASSNSSQAAKYPGVGTWLLSFFRSSEEVALYRAFYGSVPESPGDFLQDRLSDHDFLYDGL